MNESNGTRLSMHRYQPPQCLILDKLYLISYSFHGDSTPYIRMMRTHILKRLSIMFELTDDRCAKALTKYKRYANHSVKHFPAF